MNVVIGVVRAFGMVLNALGVDVSHGEVLVRLLRVALGEAVVLLWIVGMVRRPSAKLLSAIQN